MLQRALPVRHPHIAPGERLGAREQLNARTLFRAFVDHSLRLLRLLGEFVAAGGRSFIDSTPGTKCRGTQVIK